MLKKIDRLLKKSEFEILLSSPILIIGIIKLKPINSKIVLRNIIKNNKSSFVFSEFEKNVKSFFKLNMIINFLHSSALCKRAVLQLNWSSFFRQA